MNRLKPKFDCIEHPKPTYKRIKEYSLQKYETLPSQRTFILERNMTPLSGTSFSLATVSFVVTVILITLKKCWIMFLFQKLVRFILISLEAEYNSI